MVYLGSLLNLSRILGYHAKEEREVRIRLSRMEKRMYFAVNLPGLLIMLTFGLLMLLGIGRSGGKGEGILNYLRPNEQVLVLKSALEQENPTVYHRAILEDSFEQRQVEDKWLVTFKARVSNGEGTVVVEDRQISLEGEGALKKVRTPWGAVFHAKVVCMLLILVLDLFVMKQILAMARDPEFVPHPRRFKILHGLIALLMIAMIVLVRTRVGLGGQGT
ncbi:MAG: hypothetical protein KDB07_00805 [Planctomycetes bacterium]|nr:hypothetical protein [Planctomycetota bacterium]